MLTYFMIEAKVQISGKTMSYSINDAGKINFSKVKNRKAYWKIGGKKLLFDDDDIKNLQTNLRTNKRVQ